VASRDRAVFTPAHTELAVGHAHYGLDAMRTMISILRCGIRYAQRRELIGWSTNLGMVRQDGAGRPYWLRRGGGAFAAAVIHGATLWPFICWRSMAENEAQTDDGDVVNTERKRVGRGSSLLQSALAVRGNGHPPMHRKLGRSAANQNWRDRHVHQKSMKTESRPTLRKSTTDVAGQGDDR